MTDPSDESKTESGIEYVPDHALYPPAQIGIIGGGPAGIEAALYARFLGHEVIIWERDEVATNVTSAPDSGTVAFGEQVTRLGLNALSAQSGEYQPRDADEAISLDEWKSEYLLPLAKSDLLRKSLQTNTTIESVTVRDNDAEEEEAPPYFFTVSAADGKVWDQLAAVIDTTGSGKPFLAGAERDATSDTKTPTLTTVIGYYVFGSQDDKPFEIGDAHHQIRSLFALIGDRENLDLYR